VTITPSGSPAWLRANDHETYGGSATKENYASQGAINGQTDVDAKNFVRMCADLEALQRVAEFCTIRITCNDTAPLAPTINAYLSMVDDQPTPARVGDGDARLTFATTYLDAYAVGGLVNIVMATATVEGAAAAVATVELEDPDSDGNNERVRVRAFDDAGAALADATVVVTIWTGPSA
jgi:hypothetical protein